MLHCGRLWQPTSVSRVVEQVRSSTSVVKVATDRGVGFLKGMNSRAGNESLALELIGSELACQIGLKVPPFAIIDVTDIEIERLDCGPIPFGPAFISREMKGSTSTGGQAFLRRLIDRDDVSLLIVFDTWIRNLDRCPPPQALDPQPNRDNLFFSPVRRKFEMLVFDHTHCLVEETLAIGLASDDFVDDSGVYGFFPEFGPHVSEGALRRSIAALGRIDAAAIREIVGAVPSEWGPSASVRSLLVERLCARKARVGEYIFSSLVPQLQMEV